MCGQLDDELLIDVAEAAVARCVRDGNLADDLLTREDRYGEQRPDRRMLDGDTDTGRMPTDVVDPRRPSRLHWHRKQADDARQPVGEPLARCVVDEVAPLPRGGRGPQGEPRGRGA